jgi:metal-sulfur cluster biosynthetic enzyme
VTSVGRVRERLREVHDPCSVATGSNLNVVEMGLVRSITVDGRHVHVDMRLTTPACHMVGYFHEEVEDSVGGLPGVDAVTLETDDGFEWSEDMLSAEASARRQQVLDDHRDRYESDLPDGMARSEGEASSGDPAGVSGSDGDPSGAAGVDGD